MTKGQNRGGEEIHRFFCFLTILLYLRRNFLMHMDNLIELINRPDMNVFDIISDKSYPNGFYVVTYRKDSESIEDFEERHFKNYEKALQLKKKARL